MEDIFCTFINKIDIFRNVFQQLFSSIIHYRVFFYDIVISFIIILYRAIGLYIDTYGILEPIFYINDLILRF